MKIRNLTTAAKIVVCVPPGAQAGNSAASVIDMGEYESALFILSYATDLSAAQTPVLSATAGALSTGGDQAAVTGTQTAQLGAAVSFQTLELNRPTKRYVTPVVTCNSGNQYYSVVAILFTAKQIGAPGTANQMFGNYSAEEQGANETPSLPLVPGTPTFSVTTGTFSGEMNLTSTVVAGQQYAQLIANP
jgi:hypothetical protein